MKNDLRILPISDQSMCINFGETISEAIHLKIMAFCHRVEREKIKGIIEVVPTYCNLIIHYDCLLIDYKTLVQILKNLPDTHLKDHELTSEIIEVPVLYGGEFGPDLKYVALTNNLEEREVINIHTKNEYLIYMLGFTPGFAYMGGMDSRIATPRLEAPRIKIPEGSVGIAGAQTGIYPIDSPGGWQLIGKTPLKLYDPNSEQPILFKAGQKVRFKSITKEEFYNIQKEIKEGKR